MAERSDCALLRAATPQDLEQLYRVEVLCFGERHFRQDHLDWILRNPKAMTLVEDEGAGVVGALMLLFEGQVCRVLSVAVLPNERRRGLGRRMMIATEEISRGRGCTIIRLEVSTRNLGAIEFYRRLGYEIDGVLPRYYSWGEDAYSMRKAVPLVAETTDSGLGQ